MRFSRVPPVSRSPAVHLHGPRSVGWASAVVLVAKPPARKTCALRIVPEQGMASAVQVAGPVPAALAAAGRPQGGP